MTGAWAIEVLPGEYNDRSYISYLHMVLMRDMGVTLGKILDFDELANDCAGGVWEFFFCAPPLKVTARSIARTGVDAPFDRSAPIRGEPDEGRVCPTPGPFMASAAPLDLIDFR